MKDLAGKYVITGGARSFAGVPSSVYTVPLVKAVLPPGAMDFLNRVLGISTSSRTTKGRPD